MWGRNWKVRKYLFCNVKSQEMVYRNVFCYNLLGGMCEDAVKIWTWESFVIVWRDHGSEFCIEMLDGEMLVEESDEIERSIAHGTVYVDWHGPVLQHQGGGWRVLGNNRCWYFWRFDHVPVNAVLLIVDLFPFGAILKEDLSFCSFTKMSLHERMNNDWHLWFGAHYLNQNLSEAST